MKTKKLYSSGVHLQEMNAFKTTNTFYIKNRSIHQLDYFKFIAIAPRIISPYEWQNFPNWLDREED